MEVKPTNIKDIFLCQSETNPEILYEVSIATNSCTCLHYQKKLINSGGVCKHYIKVINYLKKIEINQPKIEFETGDDAVVFIAKYGEEVLNQMKRDWLVREKQGKLIKI